MRVAMAFIGLVVAVTGALVALELVALGADDAGGWMLAAAGLALCVVAVWPGHAPTIGRTRTRRQVP